MNDTWQFSKELTNKYMNCYLQVELLLLPHNNNKKRNKTAEKIRSTRISQCLQQKNSGASFDALSGTCHMGPIHKK